ncbi:hypothetical protein PNI02_24030 [Pseudoalteromonas nigrifaciens]|uniref:Orphan protein n=1 Tax=Pseudoalteromonas translucida (strain TAC 125) TaxID=326442 RepID=Q3IDB5_PSET1|nr:hypothetical protein PNI02_24030 [Pseudoalteromonas nigrifaciens]CAI89299.1 putative orphan protein [Pseudoalteromonas translucida]SUD23264.1 Uncharacterised protein [Pseudoalteromonas nigrifaciens]
MKKYILLALTLTLVGCGSNSDGSSKSTYSSCKITQSNAILASNRDNDLKQCWNASGNGYESQGDALQWCEKTVNNYLSNKYLVTHSVTYAVESTYCPK